MNAPPNNTSSDISTSFAEQGYYLAPQVFDEDELQRMESEFDRIVSQLETSGEEVNARWDSDAMDGLDDGATQVLHTHNVHRYSAVWLQAIQQQRFLDVAEQILGPDIVLHHTKLFQKPAQEGAPFPIHQDWWYFPTQRDSMIAAIVFLSDSNDDSGGLRVYPGSHRLGRLENSSGMQASTELAEYPLDQATPIAAKRGDVLFFSYFTLHGSLPNRSDNPRKTVLVQMLSGRDYVLDNPAVNHVHEQLVLRGWNYHMGRALAAR